jgi:hypothetical protein
MSAISDSSVRDTFRSLWIRPRKYCVAWLGAWSRASAGHPWIDSTRPSETSSRIRRQAQPWGDYQQHTKQGRLHWRLSFATARQHRATSTKAASRVVSTPRPSRAHQDKKCLGATPLCRRAHEQMSRRAASAFPGRRPSFSSVKRSHFAPPTARHALTPRWSMAGNNHCARLDRTNLAPRTVPSLSQVIR